MFDDVEPIWSLVFIEPVTKNDFKDLLLGVMDLEDEAKAVFNTEEPMRINFKTKDDLMAYVEEHNLVIDHGYDYSNHGNVRIEEVYMY